MDMIKEALERLAEANAALFQEFDSARDNFEQKAADLESTTAGFDAAKINDLSLEIRELLSSKEFYGKAFPSCPVAQLAQWIGNKASAQEVGAACALMRARGWLPDVRDVEGSISNEVVYTHIPPLYDDAVFYTISGAFAGNPIGEYLWYNKTSVECLRIFNDGKAEDVIDHIEMCLNKLVGMVNLMQMDAKGSTLH